MVLDACPDIRDWAPNGLHTWSDFLAAARLLRSALGISPSAWRESVEVMGETDAAIRLEVLWNELASTHTFSLLCGYAIGNFYKEASRLEEVCRQHTHVLGAHVLPIDAANHTRALG